MFDAFNGEKHMAKNMAKTKKCCDVNTNDESKPKMLRLYKIQIYIVHTT